MAVCYGTFTIPNSTGAQVISDIKDVDGSTTFTAKFILLWTTKVPTAGSLDSGYASVGMTDGTRQVARGFFANVDNVAVAGAVSAEAYTENACLWLKKYTTGTFSNLMASISAVADGTFTLTWSAVDSDADVVHFLAVGGTAIDCRMDFFTAPATAGAQTQTVTGLSFQPTGLVTIGPMTTALETWTSTSVNGCRMGAFGFVSNALVNQSSSSYASAPLDGTITATSMYRAAAWNEYEMNASTGRPTMITGSVSGMTADGFTVNWSTLTAAGRSLRVPYLAFTGIALYTGRIFCPSATGSQVTVGATSFTPQALIFQTLGYFASTQLNLDPPKQPLRFSTGCAMADSGFTQGAAAIGDASNQLDETISSRTLSTDSCILGVVPASDGTAAIVYMEAALTAVSSTGFTLDWDSTFEDAEVFVAAFGSSSVDPDPPPPDPPPDPPPPVPPPVPTGMGRATRRLRRFPLPFNQNMWVYLSYLEVLIQSGVGVISGQGSDPQMMVRLSRDGGRTWTPEITMGMGRMGQYDWRAYLNKIGRGRNYIVELTTSDPVFVAMLEAFIDVEPGTA